MSRRKAQTTAEAKWAGRPIIERYKKPKKAKIVSFEFWNNGRLVETFTGPRSSWQAKQASIRCSGSWRIIQNNLMSDGTKKMQTNKSGWND